jgi:hypothetical protein
MTGKGLHIVSVRRRGLVARHYVYAWRGGPQVHVQVGGPKPRVTAEIIQAAAAAMASSQSATFLTHRKGDDLLEQVQSASIESGNVDEVAYKLTKILTAGHPLKDIRARKGKRPHFQNWKRSLPMDERFLVKYWEQRAERVSLLNYLLSLYEADYGKTRDFFKTVVRYRPYLDYPDLLMVQVIYDQLHVSIPTTYFPNPVSEETKQANQKLLKGDAFARWMKFRKGNLKEYGKNTESLRTRLSECTTGFRILHMMSKRVSRASQKKLRLISILAGVLQPLM